MHEGNGSKISPELLARLSDRGGQRSYARGELLIREGDASTEVYILLAGELTAYTTDAAGKELIYGTMTPGEFFGELSLDGGPRTASVRAASSAICVVVPQSEVQAFLGEYPEFARDLVMSLIARVRSASRALAQGNGRSASSSASKPSSGTGLLNR
jgi:CRP/FNR family cyclic AMP-dependent transcriptional regulator